MKINFYNENKELLTSYNSYISLEEIDATVELLEHENNCNVSVEIEA